MGSRSVGLERSAVFVISADYEQRTGGYRYDMRLLDELRGRGWAIHEKIAPAGFPNPDASAKTETAALLASLPDGTLVLSDQLVTSVLPEVMAAERDRLRLVPIVHHPLALENDDGVPDAAVAGRERQALACAQRVIVTSATTAAILARDYAVDPARLVVARPGVDRLPIATGSGQGALQLISVGAVVPRKDHGTLVAALAGLRGRPWRLSIVGNTTRAADHAAGLRAQITAARLEGQVTLTGEMEEAPLAALWSRADLYVSASALEGFGMAVAEAVGRGLPVVTTAAGAVAGWLDRRAAVIVDVGDADALRRAIEGLLDMPGRLAALRQGALAARAALPAWNEAGAIVDNALLRLG